MASLGCRDGRNCNTDGCVFGVMVVSAVMGGMVVREDKW